MKGLKHQQTEDSWVKKVVEAQSCNFPMNVANVRQNFDWTLQIFNGRDCVLKILIFALNFFSKWTSTSPNFAVFGQTFSDKKIFWQFFDNWKFTVSNSPRHHLPPCHNVTDSESNQIELKFFRIKLNRTCCQLNRQPLVVSNRMPISCRCRTLFY